jgi:hypothetical protein
MATKPEVEWQDDYSAPKRGLPTMIGRWSVGGFSVLLMVIFFYYGIGAFLMHKVDDDLSFQATNMPEGGSRSVAVTGALVSREIDLHEWTSNDPFFMPSAVLDNMPNFQQGIVYAASRFVLELADQLGRVRGSSQVDADLDRAAGQLKYPANRWMFDLSVSFAPIVSSEAEYRSAVKALANYNKRLSSGEAVFEARADNLQGTLLRITADLGSSSAVIDTHLPSAGGFGIDTTVDDIFHQVKGRTYAYYLILRELKADFAKVIADRDIGQAWDRMLGSMAAAAGLSPVIVMNGALDGVTVPNHIAVQGFYLLRARTQLREITDILQK